MVRRGKTTKRQLQSVLPPNTAIHQEKYGQDRWIKDPRVIKWHWRARGFVRGFLRGFVGPVLNSGALFRLLTVPFFLFFVFLFAGGKGVIDESIIITSGVLALVATLPAWALLNVLVAPFRQILAERAEGYWLGSRFIYHQRKHLVTIEWSPSENGRALPFKVPGIPKDALVDYAIEVDGPGHMIRCMLVGRFSFYPVVPVLELWEPALRGSVRLKRNRMLHLYCYSQTNALPIIVRVYALAFDVQPKSIMYYTDHRLDVSIKATDGKEAPQIEAATKNEDSPNG